MSILLTVNGAAGDQAFLIAPDQNHNFPAQLGLRTDDGSTVSASLQVLPGGATLQLDQTEVTVGPAETFVSVHATTASGHRGDTTVQALVNGAAQGNCALTAVTDVKVWFQGRFQARFATDNDPYNSPRGANGWTFAMEGEADFVPSDSVADRIDKPVGRQIRFHDPVDLRPEVPPIGVAVTAVSGKLTGGQDERFTAGDPVLGLPVDLGPNSYFAGNSPPPPGTKLAEGPNQAGHEPIALFEFHLGAQLSGKSLNPEDRPITSPILGLEILTPAQLTKLGIPALSAFNAQRKTALQARLDAMIQADQTGTAGGRNLQARITRLAGPLNGTTLTAGWLGREWFTGVINDAIQIDPQGSAVLQFLQGIGAFWFSAAFFNFHADELCGQVLGYVGSAQDDPVDPFEPGTAAATHALAAPESRTISRRDLSAVLPDDVRDFL